MNRNRNNEDKARQRNIYAKRHLQNDLDAQREMERAHLQTIRNEKIRLQRELERMKNKGQYMVKRHGISNHTQRLLKLRFSNDPSLSQDAEDGIDGVDQDDENRVGLPDIDPSKKKSGKMVTNQELRMTREDRVREHRRKEAAKRQEELVARVGKLADDFKEKQQQQDVNGDVVGGYTRRRRSMVSLDNADAKSEGAQTSKSDGFYTVPPHRRGGTTRGTKMRTSSIVDVSLTDAKSSVARRLLPSEATQRDDGDNQTRKISNHVIPMGLTGANKTVSKAEDLIFDQDMFAPDGQVRTVHLLPDAGEAFREAKKARYLRTIGGNAMDTELSVDEMFANDDDEEDEDEEQSVYNHTI